MSNTNSLIEKFLTKIPADLEYLKEDLSQHLQILFNDFASNLKLVSREEFDAQTKVLQRTRAELEMLQKELKKLAAYFPPQ